ncbi:sigma-70 family RNA polymerase sigma factor [Prolixibacteraceae bacterium JC049]|nr:sigma-70 family RNA polymerase sigma factor [Prolixibacteraceae bacterium JC049]
MFLSKKNPKLLTDEQLLQQYQEQADLDFLGELYSRYMHLVYGVCLKYLSDREKAKDAVSQLFEKLVVELPSAEVKNFKPWLYVVCKNFCLMELRKEKSIQNKQNRYNQEQIMESTSLLHPIDEAPNKNVEQRLKQCMERLKEEQRMCLEAFYYGEKSYDEIVQEQNIPIKKVKSYLQNGKRNLKICLEKLVKQYEH